MNNSPRILMLLPSLAGNGGIQRFNRTLLHASESCSMVIKAISIKDSDESLQSVDRGSNTVLAAADGKRLKFVLMMLRELVSGSWDVVVIGHVNLLVTVMLLLPWTKCRRARTFFIAHGIEIWGQLNGLRRYAITACSCVASVSNYTRTSVLEQVPSVAVRKCVVFPNALSENWIGLQDNMVVPDQHMRLPERFILSVTRLASTERYKGLVSIIESLSGVDDTDIHSVIAGKGSDADFLKRVAIRCGVALRVHILSDLSDAQLSILYRKALAFVLPSGKEGFGIVYLEAMHFGLPVIAARARGAVDVVRDGDTGLLVEYGDVAAIARSINRLTNDEALRNHLVNSGKRLVTDDGEFTELAMMQRWRKMITS